MPPPIMPVDLYRPIVEEVRQQGDLLSLSLTNQSFNHEATRMLYRDISFPVTPNKFPRLHLLLDLLSSNTARALLVNSFSVDLLRPVRQSLRPTRNKLAKALPRMINLLTLNIPFLLPSNFGSVFRKCSFELQTFYCDSDIHYNALISFLALQPGLRALYIAGGTIGKRTPDPCPPSYAPRLSVLSGRFRDIQSLLPGRNVTRLKWRGTSLEFFPMTPVPSLRVLSLSSITSNFHMCNLGMSCPNLRFFECHAHALDKYDIHRLVAGVPLHTLRLVKRWSGDECHDFAVDIFASCQSLRALRVNERVWGVRDDDIKLIDATMAPWDKWEEV